MNTQSGNPLRDLIRREITTSGPVSFSWFMRQALYHPDYGYYSTGRAAIGRSGDFFTNVSVGPTFGRLLAAQLHEIWEQLGPGPTFTVVEQGAHDGQLAHDILTAVRWRLPEFYGALCYTIVEPFPALQDRQSQTLREFGDKVSWRKSLAHLEPFVGVSFSNELLDSIPVDLSQRKVGMEGDRFVFVEQFAPDQTATEQLDWIDNVAAKLERGFVLIVDYGFAGPDFHEVVQARAQHRNLDSPFEQIGEADISVHINWTRIAERAETDGFRVVGFTDQHHFLTGIIATWPDQPQDPKTKRALQTLLHPEMLGRAFHVLALSKNIDRGLSGFHFARNPRKALGLDPQ